MRFNPNEHIVIIHDKDMSDISVGSCHLGQWEGISKACKNTDAFKNVKIMISMSYFLQMR